MSRDAIIRTVADLCNNPDHPRSEEVYRKHHETGFCGCTSCDSYRAYAQRERRRAITATMVADDMARDEHCSLCDESADFCPPFSDHTPYYHPEA